MSAATFATRVLEARNNLGLLDAGPEPLSFAEAYEAQRLIGTGAGESVAGWKVADHPVLGQVAAPIFARASLDEGAEWPLQQGECAELEVALWLKRDLPRGTYTRSEIADAISGYSIGVEIVGSRLKNPTRNLYAFLGDQMSNVGYIMGKDRIPWRDLGVPGRRCLFTIDGQVISDSAAAPPALDPLDATAGWLAVACDALGGLKAGQFVTTGAISGVMPIPSKGLARAEIEGLGAVAFRLI